MGAKRVMKAAAALLKEGDIYIADLHKPDEHGSGWIDCYSYEPFAKQTEYLNSVIQAIKPFLNDHNCYWEFRLFCQDGYRQCHCDGRELDDDGIPIQKPKVQE